MSESGFVAMREKRDATLALPRLILPALQVNIRAGQLPKAEENGRQYLKSPLIYFKLFLKVARKLSNALCTETPTCHRSHLTYFVFCNTPVLTGARITFITEHI